MLITVIEFFSSYMILNARAKDQFDKNEIENQQMGYYYKDIKSLPWLKKEAPPSLAGGTVSRRTL